MRVVSLASGSAGNACLVEHGGAVLLVDCGISCRQIRNRAKAVGFDLSGLAAVLITHSHNDHVEGLRVLQKRFGVPVFANLMTAESVVRLTETPEEAFTCFENGQEFEIAGFSVSPFSIPHDTSDPVGYLIRAAGVTYFHGTDIGTPLDSVGLKLAAADLVTLESNHDPVLLKTSDRAESLKQRIAGPRGHLSNDEAADLVRRFASPRLRCLALAHLSRECNAPHLAENAMREALRDLRRTDVELAILEQDVPGRVMEIAGGESR